MAKPVLLTIDDERTVLGAVERDLMRRYRKDYRVLKALSGERAISITRELKQKGIPVALFLVDQRMPAMTGTEFLTNASHLFPDARKVLLTAYADTQVAIESINSLGLDFYLMKPWDPPEEKLYPVLDDLLSDWAATVRLPYEGIRVVGTLWSPKSHEVKEFLARHQIPYQWLDVETSEEARQLAEVSAKDRNRYPTVLFPDGTSLVEPSTRALAEKVGLQITARKPFYDVVVVGAGPAGLAAAVYAASEGLGVLLIEREATGGQAGTSAQIDNYLGFPKGLSGADLARRAVTQARRFGAEILSAQEVVALKAQGPYRYVVLGDGQEISAHTVLISTGISTRRLDVPGSDRLSGAGVYYGAAYSEAAYFKGQEVFVLGGGNSAGQGAMLVARHAKRVTVVVRGGSLAQGMSQYLVDILEQTANLRVLPHTQIKALKGRGKLEKIVTVSGASGETKTHPAAALFIFIGAVPRTEFLSQTVALDERGFILTGTDLMQDGKRPPGWPLDRDPLPLETNLPGVFAGGDVRHGATNRVASAIGDGAIAVSLIHRYLKTV